MAWTSTAPQWPQCQVQRHGGCERRGVVLCRPAGFLWVALLVMGTSPTLVLCIPGTEPGDMEVRGRGGDARGVAAKVAAPGPAHVVMESSSEEDWLFDAPAAFPAMPVDFAWGEAPQRRDLTAAEAETATETSTRTETSSTTATTSSGTTITTSTTMTSTTVTTTTQQGGGPAPAPSPSVFESTAQLDVSVPAEATQGDLELICDGIPAVVSQQTGILESLIECLGFISTGTEGRRLSSATVSSILGYFLLRITSESEADAAVVTTEVASLNATAVATGIEEAVGDELNFTVEVAGVTNVATSRETQPQAVRGAMEVTVSNADYTGEQVSDFLKDVFVQALSSTTTADGEPLAVTQDNVTISVDSSTSLRFTILSLTAAEDLAILGALLQADTRAVLQEILDGAGVAMSIEGLALDYEISGLITVRSNATDSQEQQRLTDADAYDLDAMMESLRADAASAYGLLSTEVGIHLLNVIPFAEGDSASNEIELVYSYVPGSFERYCDIAEDQATEAAQARLSAALAYEGADASILPFVEAFSQDPVLAECSSSVGRPVSSDETEVATSVIILLAAGSFLILLGLLATMHFAWRRRACWAKEPVEDQEEEEEEADVEAGVHRTVPPSTIQVTLPPVSGGHFAEVEDDEPPREHGAELETEDQILEYIDDEPRI